MPHQHDKIIQFPLHRGAVYRLDLRSDRPARREGSPLPPADLYALFANQSNAPVQSDWFDRLASAAVWTVIFIGALTFWIGLLAWLVLS